DRAVSSERAMKRIAAAAQFETSAESALGCRRHGEIARAGQRDAVGFVVEQPRIVALGGREQRGAEKCYRTGRGGNSSTVQGKGLEGIAAGKNAESGAPIGP